MQQSNCSPPSPSADPAAAEDALLGLLMALGRMVRQRRPGDEIDYAALPLLKLLTHQGPLRLSTIAQQLGLDASTVSRQVRQLEDRGQVERAEDAEDRRASRVRVSSYGAECLARGFATRRRVLTTALADWDTQDRETLRVLTSRLVDDLAAADTPLATTHLATLPAPTQETSA